MIIAGIDPSLTGTGVALINTNDRLAPETWTITTKGKAGDTLTQRAHRLHRIADEIGIYTADLVVIEAPAYSSRQGSQHDRSGLWWAIVHQMLTTGIPVAEVAPSCRARYATGKGNAPKDAVLLAVARRYPHVAVNNNNEADALILAAMGADHLGAPLVEDLPATHRAALTAVHWPTLAGAA